MRRVNETRPRINPQTQFPERLRVVRSASVHPFGVSYNSSAFVTDGRACWRPGMSHPDARPVNALDALKRHADVAARRGVYAPDRRREAA